MTTERSAGARRALRWTGYVAVAIVFAILCAYLSNWQFSRNAERSEQLELVAKNYDATAVPLGELLPPSGALDPADQWHPVTLTGRYATDEQVLVRNRPHGGTVAFEVLVPLRTDDGRVFLINRGWVPPGDEQPDPDVIPAPPEGDVTVIARLLPGEALPSSGRSAPAGQVPTLNLPLVAQVAGDGDLETGAYGLMVSEDPAPPTRPTAIDAPSADPGPYLSYAIQWILFAVMGFVFIGYVIRSELRHRREDAEEARARGDDEALAENLPRPEVSPAVRAHQRAMRNRRRDRDMQDEDALLDRIDG